MVTAVQGYRQAAWKLVVDGRDIGKDARPRLISLSLTEKRGSEADELEIQLSDHDKKLRIPPTGALITLSLGWRDISNGGLTLVDKGRFKVDERSHAGSPDVLTIRARSADLTRAYRRRRSTSWSGTTLGAVVSEIAGRNALDAAVSPELSAVPIAFLEQQNESDAALIARLGRRYDAVATVKAGALIFSAMGRGQTAKGVTLPGASLSRVDGDRHSWKSAERGAYSGVVAVWQDRAAAERKEVVVGDEDNARRLGRTYASEAAARSAAQAEMSRINRGKAEFSLTLAAGRADLFPERRLKVTGFKPEIDAADWLIVEARHAVAGEGFVTSLQMELGA